MNLLYALTAGTTAPLCWTHEPVWSPLPDGGIRVTAPALVDYFQDPLGAFTRDSAPFLWLPVTGDFVAQVLVKPTFTSTWDAGALMVRAHEQLWAKVCYESTDLGSTAIISVVTQELSDDANGMDLTVPDVHLQLVRRGDLFAMHYALDGVSWRMVRVFALPMPAEVQVGLVTQSPGGPGTTVDFMQFSIEHRTLANMRAGV